MNKTFHYQRTQEEISKRIATPSACFIFFFMIYTFFGMLISYPGIPEPGNVIFHSDGINVIPELYDPSFGNETFASWHSSRHPIFVLLLQPVVHLLYGITSDYALSMLLLVALCGAAATSLLMMTLRELQVSYGLTLLFVLIYGFSFSSLLFFSIIETFAFNGLGVIATWFFVLKISGKEGNLSRNEFVILISLGIFDMGITITNYLHFIASIIFLCIAKKGMSHKVRSCLIAVLLPVFFVLVLVEVEVSVWPQYNRFYIPMIAHFFFGADWETMHFTDGTLSLEKLAIWIKQLILAPIVASDVIVSSDKLAEFGEYNLIQKACVTLFCIIGIGLTCLELLKVIKERKIAIRYSLFYLFAFGVVVFYLAFHFYYNPKEGFIYSQNYLSLMVILFGFAISRLENDRLKKAIAVVLSASIAIMFYLNAIEFFEVVQIVWLDASHRTSIGQAVFISLIAGTLSALCWTSLARIKKNILSSNGSLAYLAVVIHYAIVLLYVLFLAFSIAR